MFRFQLARVNLSFDIDMRWRQEWTRRRWTGGERSRSWTNLFLLGDYGMHSGCIDQWYSLRIVQWATFEHSLGHWPDVNSRTHSGTHVQVGVVSAPCSLHSTCTFPLQRLSFEFLGVPTVDRRLDIRAAVYLCRLQSQFPGEIHHTLHGRLFCFVSRDDLHLRCHTRDSQDSQSLSGELSAECSSRLLLFMRVHRYRLQWDVAER